MLATPISLIVRTLVALFCAVQIWVWLRFLGAFWLSDSLELAELLVQSVAPVRTSIFAFFLLLLPALAISLALHASLSTNMRITLFSFVGSHCSTLYLLIMASFDLVFIQQQLGVYAATGAASGFFYAVIFDFRLDKSNARRRGVSRTRRTIIETFGLIAGATSTIASSLGPLYFWRNENESIDVDLSALEVGQQMIVKLANKPVWILKRSSEVIDILEEHNERLLDPVSAHSYQPPQARNPHRSIKPQYFVAYGICTHLGCAPTYRPDGRADQGHPEPHFFCPCHGGVFDLAGRVYKNTPPPLNLNIPKHEFVAPEVVRLYFPSLKDEWKG